MKQLVGIFLVIVMLLGIVGCGGGSGGAGVSANVISYKESPELVSLVSITSKTSNSILLEWLETSDNDTLQKDIIYEIHLSQNNNFSPNANTLKKTIIGTDNIVIEGLDKNTQYYAQIVAKDKGNNFSLSNIMSVKTANITSVANAKTKSINNYTLDGDKIIVDTNTTQINVGDILIGLKDEGFLRKVNSITHSGSKTIAITSLAGLTSALDSFDAETSVKLVDVESSAKQTSHLRKSTNSSGESVVEKRWGSGLRITSTKKNPTIVLKRNVRTIKNTSNYVTPQNLTMNGKHSTLGGSAFVLRPKEKHRFSIKYLSKENIETSCANYYYNPIGGGKKCIEYNTSPAKVCYADISIRSEKTESKKSFNDLNNISSESEGSFSNINFNWTPKDSDRSSETLILKITSYVGAEKDGYCDKENIKESFEQEYKLFVTYGKPPTVDTNKKVLSLKGELPLPKNFKITTEMSMKFEPKITINPIIVDKKLHDGKIEINGTMIITQSVKADIIGKHSWSGSADIYSKRFYRVVMAGPVPVLFVGDLSITARIDANATTDVSLKTVTEYSIPFSGGFEFIKKGPYKGEIQAIPTEKKGSHFQVTLEGEAKGQLGLSVHLIPKFTLKVYNRVGGGVALDPYLYSILEASALASVQNYDGKTSFDGKIGLDRFEFGGGLQLGVYAVAKVFDDSEYLKANLPDTLKEDDFDTYKIFTIIKRTSFSTLPTLSSDYRIDKKNIENSRTLLLNAQAKNNNPKGFDIIKFRDWLSGSVYKFAKLENGTLGIANTPPDTVALKRENSYGSYRLTFNKPGRYYYRLYSNTNLGSYVIRNHEKSIDLVDDNKNNIPDIWEHAYGVYNDGLDDDSDGDGLTKAQEYARGLNPEKSDTDNDGMKDGWEVKYGLNPYFNDAKLDLDGDSLTNIQEFLKGTNPSIKDILDSENEKPETVLPIATVKSITPISAILNEPTKFIITGTNLPKTLKGSLQDSLENSCSQTSYSLTKVVFICTPGDTGIKEFYLRDTADSVELQKEKLLVNVNTQDICKFTKNADGLARALFKLSASGTIDNPGHVTAAYLMEGYSQYIAGMDVHAGIDYRASIGKAVYSVVSGKVVKAENGYGYGMVGIQTKDNDGNTILFSYAHLKSTSLNEDDDVKVGDLIGYTGTTGTKAAHLHVEYRPNYTSSYLVGPKSCTNEQCSKSKIASLTRNPVEIFKLACGKDITIEPEPQNPVKPNPDNEPTPKAFNKLIKTNQTQCYDWESATPVTCTEDHKGQDGYYKRGINSSLRRISSEDILSDSSTSLMWSDESVSGDKSVNWTEANEYCKKLSIGGFDDWLLPSSKELLSTRDYGSGDKMKNPKFANIGDGYWTRDSYTKNSSNAWYVTFGNRNSAFISKASALLTRCVRYSDK